MEAIIKELKSKPFSDDTPFQALKSLSPVLRLKSRLKKIGISIEYMGNIPWIYIVKIDGQPVKEKYMSEHGFTLAYVNASSGKISLSNTNKIFDLIRKYSKKERNKK